MGRWANKTDEIYHGCDKKKQCVPYNRGCDAAYCKDCFKHNYLYFFNGDGDNKMKVVETSFIDSRHHKTIKTGSGATFGW